jgi:hypothetical protein
MDGILKLLSGEYGEYRQQWRDMGTSRLSGSHAPAAVCTAVSCLKARHMRAIVLAGHPGWKRGRQNL